MRALVIVALIAAPAVAQAPDNTAVRAAAAAFDQAQQVGDRATLERMLAPDFLFVRGSGRIGDRKDFIDGFTGPNQKLDPFVIRDRMLLRIAPDVAVVGGEAWVSGVEDGKRFAEHFRFADTFALRGGQWLAVFTQVTALPPSPAPRD